ncbi:MAG: ABC transporter permease [Bacillota bacterium]|nr:ABC transporter permease [Bacillota bacterium]
MKPLSIFKFIKGSSRKILPLAVTVCLSSGLLYFLSICITHITTENEEFNVYPLSNMSVLSGTGEKVSKDTLNSDLVLLRENKDIKTFFKTNQWKVNLSTPSSDNGIYMILMQNRNIPYVMKCLNMKLTSGKVPDKKNEVLLHEKLAANYNLKAGSIIPKESKGWYNKEDLKVTGIYKGKAILGLGCTDDKSLSGDDYLSVITLADNDSVADMNRFLENNFGNRYQIYTAQRALKEINQKNKNINVVIFFVGVVVIIVLGFLLGNLCMIQYNQRLKEFELLHAMGYTKKYIASKVFKEIGSSTFIGYLAGIAIAVFAGWLTNIMLMDSKLLSMELIIGKNILWILLVPLIVTLSGMITPLKLLKFRDIA